MTVDNPSHQIEQRRWQRQSPLTAPFDIDHDNQILSFREWCMLNKVSERTGRRILSSGAGPAVTQLSDRRIGVSIGANRRWQQSRQRL